MKSALVDAAYNWQYVDASDPFAVVAQLVERVIRNH